ncbi:hypothetical protein scyTo_0011673, partial [Scyliorhinus torazame]|nr:hypothetical protein [Scyliorhinus torazame]
EETKIARGSRGGRRNQAGRREEKRQQIKDRP